MPFCIVKVAMIRWSQRWCRIRRSQLFFQEDVRRIVKMTNNELRSLRMLLEVFLTATWHTLYQITSQIKNGMICRIHHQKLSGIWKLIFSDTFPLATSIFAVIIFWKKLRNWRNLGWRRGLYGIYRHLRLSRPDKLCSTSLLSLTIFLWTGCLLEILLLQTRWAHLYSITSTIF